MSHDKAYAYVVITAQNTSTLIEGLSCEAGGWVFGIISDQQALSEWKGMFAH
jgi:hypothetical protein